MLFSFIKTYKFLPKKHFYLPLSNPSSFPFTDHLTTFSDLPENFLQHHQWIHAKLPVK